MPKIRIMNEDVEYVPTEVERQLEEILQEIGIPLGEAEERDRLDPVDAIVTRHASMGDFGVEYTRFLHDDVYFSKTTSDGYSAITPDDLRPVLANPQNYNFETIDFTFGDSRIELFFDPERGLEQFDEETGSEILSEAVNRFYGLQSRPNDFTLTGGFSPEKYRRFERGMDTLMKYVATATNGKFPAPKDVVQKIIAIGNEEDVDSEALFETFIARISGKGGVTKHELAYVVGDPISAKPLLDYLASQGKHPSTRDIISMFMGVAHKPSQYANHS